MISEKKGTIGRVSRAPRKALKEARLQLVGIVSHSSRPDLFVHPWLENTCVSTVLTCTRCSRNAGKRDEQEHPLPLNTWGSLTQVSPRGRNGWRNLENASRSLCRALGLNGTERNSTVRFACHIRRNRSGDLVLAPFISAVEKYTGRPHGLFCFLWRNNKRSQALDPYL